MSNNILKINGKLDSNSLKINNNSTTEGGDNSIEIKDGNLIINKDADIQLIGSANTTNGWNQIITANVSNNYIVKNNHFQYNGSKGNFRVTNENVTNITISPSYVGFIPYSLSNSLSL